MKSIAIIGAGFSGTMTAVHLLFNKDLDSRIILYDTSMRPGRGVAYDVESLAFLLNVPAESMGAYPESPEHFFNWLEKNDYSYKKTDFVPRKIYGDYLESLLAGAAKQSGRLEIRRTKVLSIEKEDLCWKIQSENSDVLKVDAVVLAVGFSRQNFEFLSPHHEDSYAGIKECSQVVIVGSGLTAVDVFEQSRYKGYEGKYIVLSRSGKFPYPHGTSSHEEADLETLKLIDRSDRPLKLLEVLKCLRSDIVANGPDDVLHALRPHTAKLWSQFSKKEKNQFYTHLASRWNRVRHRMPQSSANNISKLLTENKLRILSAQFVDCKGLADGSFQINYIENHLIGSIQADKAFDCRGPSSSARNNPLVASLLDQGVLKVSQLGKGVQTDSVGRATSDKELPMFIVGPLRNEQMLESTAVRELRQQASEVAFAVAQSVS